MPSHESARIRDRMALYDGLPPEGRALVGDYGLNAALSAWQATGAWSAARGFLETRRGLPPARLASSRSRNS